MNLNRRCLYPFRRLYALKLASIFKIKALILLASFILTNSALACDNSVQPSGNFLIQAECFESFDGVELETTTDIGGGQNVGYIDAFDSMTYSLNIPTTGNYLFQYRTASLYGSDPGFSVYVNDQIVDSFSIPSTNGWQNWQTQDGRVINLTSGSNTIKFVAFSSGMNLNWFSLSPSLLDASQPPEIVGNFENAEPIDNSKWHHQTLLPNGYSWYNNELQHYTNRLNNSYVSNGTLKIVARKETFTDQGHTKQYTSARLNSKFAFKYGRVEFKAKMPYGSGTWPAVWMLGKNINEDGSYWDQLGYGNTSWPAVGEIDILEHWGSNQGYASSAVHTTSSSGNTVNYGGDFVSDISSKFHIYSMEWDSDKIIFKIDGNEHYRYDPSVKNSETWPFDDEFFLLLNVAIEPSVTPGFTQSQMEVDYIRVYDLNGDPIWSDEFGSDDTGSGDSGSDDNNLLTGNWMLSPTAGSLGVGPNQGDISWWSADDAEVVTRACLYDDLFSFNADGSFANTMGADTWLEGWQGTEGCGAPVAPFDGSNAATYSYDASAGTLTVSGLGAHIGLPKVNNAGEIDDVANAVSSITYTVTEISDTAMTLDIDFGGGWWRYELVCADDSCTNSAGDTGSGDTGSDGSDLNNGNTESEFQIVSISNTGAVSPGQQFTLDVNYDVSSGDNTVTGLGLYIHYDSSKLTFSQISDYINKDIVTTAFSSSLDVEDFDNDSSTDRYVTLAWAAVFSGDWPNVPLPTKLLSIDFTVNDLDLDSTDTTTISFSSPSNDAGFDFSGIDYQLQISPTAPMSWDVDQNGEADALTDGLLMLRYAFGLTGEALVNNAVAINSPLGSSEIEQSIIETLSIADIDNNGQVDALTDGLLLLRYLFGLTGEALISNSVALDAARATHADIEQYIINHMPGQVMSTTDSTPPEITLNGNASTGLAFGDTYIELGAVANDETDGDVEVTITGSVDTALGTYILTYTAIDEAGNISSVTRSVEVDHAPSLSSFKFLRSNNPDLTDDITMDVNGNVISGRIPENISVKNLVATFEHDGESISVSNVNQLNGTTKNDFTQPVEYKTQKESGVSKTYTVDVTKFTGLPIIYITTTNNSNIDSKDEYFLGTVRVDGGRNVPDMELTPIEIRGRGNSTWDLHPKKPYQMKFSSKKEFLGMPEDKKWIFLAEYSDKTMLRNTTAFEMGYISNLDWTPESVFAEVYINNEYNGTYNITQKVEETNRRVAITNDGYLLEIDQIFRLDDEDVFFSTDSFSVIAIKEPLIQQIDENGISFEQDSRYIYINNFVNQFENVLFSSDFADPVSGYAAYIDVDSFVDWYLINEILKNVDARWFSSIFFHLVPGEKIKMGPLWDHDLGFGNVDYADSRYTNGWWIRQNPWISRLFQDPSFVEKVSERFIFFRDNMEFIFDKIDAHATKLQWAQQENNDKWQTIGQYVWPNPIVFDTYQEEVDHLKEWYQSRMNWLEAEINSLNGIPSSTPDTVHVTFQVDMNWVETNPDGVYLAGGDLGQDGYLLSNNGNDVWSITLQMSSNTRYMYKFRNQPSFGTWDGFESGEGLVVGGCNTGIWDDRYIDVGDTDIVLDVVAYGSCTANPI